MLKRIMEAIPRSRWNKYPQATQAIVFGIILLFLLALSLSFALFAIIAGFYIFTGVWNFIYSIFSDDFYFEPKNKSDIESIAYSQQGNLGLIYIKPTNREYTLKFYNSEKWEANRIRNSSDIGVAVLEFRRGYNCHPPRDEDVLERNGDETYMTIKSYRDCYPKAPPSN